MFTSIKYVKYPNISRSTFANVRFNLNNFAMGHAKKRQNVPHTMFKMYFSIKINKCSTKY